MLSNRATAIFDLCLDLAQRGWPQACVLCGTARGGVEHCVAAGFCAACEVSLPRLPQMRCSVCATPVESGEICGACLAMPPAYDAVTACFAYAFPVDALVQAYKYGGDLTLAPVLASAFGRTQAGRVDALVPMPLAPSRLRERGFNQAHELARHIARAARVPVLANAVRRIANTPPQAALPWKARARNVRGAFVCDVDLKGREVAVLDDVMTTGATLNEIAKVLKRAGASRVSGWVVARTLPRVHGNLTVRPAPTERAHGGWCRF